ncbi:RNA-directed DNA polymerase, eukaryota [Tanacetum coccineum]|uniref:RNA-directed DNA polymerase, eukaryota n=1 Tax=Tanacetum coccineum TaxID=301880 RepID=A0ABQ4XDK4_9ASTR
MAARARSNVDHIRLISKSIFVTNFPDNTTSKDLWEVCKGYGTVVDVFIPDRKSKAGKRFAFVRFIKVDNVDRLVGNLCTLWIGLMHLHANVARFDRPPIHFSRLNISTRLLANGASSFASVLKDVRLAYLGGLWVMIELTSVQTKMRFMKHVGVASWFSQLCKAQPDFVSRERIVWIDIEGVPLHAWSRPTFSKIGSRWGEVIELEDNKEDCFARKRICIKTKLEDNILEKFKIIVRGKNFVIRAKELFVWSPTFNDNKEVDDYSEDDSVNGAEEINGDISKQMNLDDETDIEYYFPPGFTPEREFQHVDAQEGQGMENSLSKRRSEGLSSRVLEDAQPLNEHASPSIDSKKKQVARYWSENFLSVQETKLDCISDMDVKVLWGNYKFEYTISEAVGNSGGILCVWDPSVFRKEHHVVSDNFVALYGSWVSNQAKLLVVSIYAPQSITSKRSLWSYISSLISRWDGHCMVMGDFNEVRCMEDRLGSVYNAQGANEFNSFISNSGLVEIQLEGWFDTEEITNLKEIVNGLMIAKDINSGLLVIFVSKLCHIDKVIDQGGVNDDILLTRLDLLKKLHDIKSFDARDYMQKAKIQWAIEGDENSIFFHGIINRKRANLAIKGVMVDGEWVDDPCRVKEEFRLHFANRFRAPTANRCKLNYTFPNRLSSDQLDMLESPISRDEVRNAVWGCGENKSPGPDGFTFEFFRKFWDTLGSDFCAAVEWFFDHSSFSRGCNSSFIALIPKNHDPKFVNDYRPISLIGSLYKVVTKILATRLSSIISGLISDVQTAFLPNRQILDGPFIINELLSWCKHKKQQAMVFKVDFAKAYDSIRWDFLEDVLRAFGFGSKWCSWIRGCLHSGMASVLLNGSPTSEFQFHCGLKQGDPLAPYLFILIMESLHLSLSRAIEAGIFKGIKIGSSLNISHLFYADDAVFIGEWSIANLSGITHILHCFSLLSGLSINLKKSHLLGVGIRSEDVNAAALYFGCSTMKTPFKYLGVMVGGNSSTSQAWNDTIGKLKPAVNGKKDGTKEVGGFVNSKNKSFSKESMKVKVTGSNGGVNSYVRVLKRERLKGDGDVEMPRVVVLDDDCLLPRDLSKSLLGRVKEFASLANLKMTLSNEGFMDIKIQYMGEFWVMMEFASEESKNKFRDNVSIGSWFSHINDASMEFQTEKRIAWVENEGIPFKLWSDNTFRHIAAKWGELLDVDDQEETCFHSKRICIHTKLDRNIMEEFKVSHRGKVYWIRTNETPGWVPDFADDSYDDNQDENNFNDVGFKNQDLDCFGGDSDVEWVPETMFQNDGQAYSNKEEGELDDKVEQSEDPFNIYPILNKKADKVGNDNKTDSSLKYPPGFSPIENKGENSIHGSGDSNNNMECLKESNWGEGMEYSRNSKLKKMSKDDGTDVTSTGHFKKSEIPRTGGSILGLLEEVVKVGQVMGYKMEGCMSNMVEIIETQGAEEVNFLALQETKMEAMEIFCVRACWGNLTFDYVHSAAVGNSGGILCVWDSNSFSKDSVTMSDSFVMVRGVWRLTGQKCLLIAVYAPQDAKEKQMLWDYLQCEIGRWKRDVVIMGDFNEVRYKSERFGSVFNVHGANMFNSFIMNSGLVEFNSGGSSFTWCHKSASKMSKLDRFLISENLLYSCPNINAITLERYLSDHRPILLREVREYAGEEPNAMRSMMGKLKHLKNKIREWNTTSRSSVNKVKAQYKSELEDLDSIIDRGNGGEEEVNKRAEIINKILKIDKHHSMEIAQKAKVKWIVEGDENSSFFHGMLNKKRNILNIRGVMVNGVWVDNPKRVKKEFFAHFSARFCRPIQKGASIQMEFPKTLSEDQVKEMECDVTNDEIKRAVWDCGTEKSPGPDGFTFGFFRRFWYLIQKDVNAAVRPISLIGSLYKIIAKILANRLVGVLGDIVNEVQSAFIADRQILDGPFILNEVIQWCKTKKKQALIFKVDFEKAYDSVRWDFLDEVLRKFGFGDKWCNWIQCCLKSSRGSIIVNGSPT